eukprot:Plantae.Rhodophyta-Hildenbrandia_rubra.ctg2115.p1 GENE.Plantae.Rhodophyta-Hildenbrandia_rubra.ctg2115~~Plantae.Rhodophyta-Hildenbrandia_rubra.ctg2115.p1  ORF type:complete len:1369 (+),score=220.38 Plantae.Rhodophyta-Hildenbrandia_rubra.ctg2115:6908-11014(+)
MKPLPTEPLSASIDPPTVSNASPPRSPSPSSSEYESSPIPKQGQEGAGFTSSDEEASYEEEGAENSASLSSSDTGKKRQGKPENKPSEERRAFASRGPELGPRETNVERGRKRPRSADEETSLVTNGKRLKGPSSKITSEREGNFFSNSQSEEVQLYDGVMQHVGTPLAPTLPQVGLWDDNEPSSGFGFDTAPAPPQHVPGRTTMYSGALTHGGALRRACLDLGLRQRVIPSNWICEDEAHSSHSLVVYGKAYALPPLFDCDTVCKGQERDLERAEARFRSARKEKVIGGELGSFLSKKRPQRYSLSNSRGYGFSATGRRMSFGSVAGDQGCKRLRFMGCGVADYDTGLYIDDDDTYEYRKFATTDLVKTVRSWVMQINAQQRMARGIAAACARDGKKRLVRTVRLADDAYRRGRRVFRDVMTFWRKEDRERLEERKKLFAEADAVKRKEAEQREEQRQKNKLKFLLGQSEAFSSFLQAKVQATTKAAENDASPDVDLGKRSGIDSVTGTEDEEELYRKAEASAAELVAAHRARLDLFDSETKKAQNVSPGAYSKDVLRGELPPSDIEDKPLHNGKSNEKDRKSPREAGSEREVAPVKQPQILTGKMKDYQLRGLSWIVSLYDQGINGILADEMGLGKTIQTISFLAYLAEKEKNWGPFLVVTPKATLHNWQQEICKFCPSLRVLPYWGSKNDRKELRKHWSPRRMYRRDSEFHVCVTSYEILTTDEKYFPRVKWQYLVLDEAQAIKNSSSIRWKALLQFPCRNRLLLTGTPLQNKMSELWSLLHFIMPAIFDSHAEFADWFAKDIEGHAQQNKMLDKSTIARLRTLLDPFMLRRVKHDVENEMPSKTEVEIRCELTPRQKHLYSAVKKSISVPKLLQSVVPGKESAITGKASHGALMNLVMQLRKVCNHPETFQRRTALSPFQFQLPSPPSQSPVAHAVLMASNEVQPPQELVFLSRSPIPCLLPRLIDTLRDACRTHHYTTGRRMGIWEVDLLKESILYTPMHLAGGLSAGEASQIMTSAVMDLWVYQDILQKSDGLLKIMRRVYGSGDWRGYCIQSDDQVVQPPMKRPHRILVNTRAQALVNVEDIILPWKTSPADILETDSKLLKTTTVYMPPVICPPIVAYYPGDPKHSLENLPDTQFRYPPSSPERPFEDQYRVWRALFGEYGRYIGSAPIIMPEPGRLVADAGKMKVLDKLLRRLKREGHKCLIYSQFTKVLDILEDYCGGCGIKYLRLDGQSGLSERRDMVANWQSNDELFVFLLSTRAGGVGINLTAADTVIFYDSDWNPTSDSQAMDRAHRLGQERPVTVYRLVTVGTIEERMLLRAKQKNRINELVIKGGGVESMEMNENEANIDDLATLLMGEDEG